jgi:hypothetical protein
MLIEPPSTPSMPFVAPASRAAILLTATALLLGACKGSSGSHCGDSSRLRNELTPVELAQEAADCARRGDLHAAGLRYGLAMAFSTFDNERAGDGDPPGWKGTRSMLPQLLLRSRLRPEELAALLNDFKAATKPGPRHSEFCSLLRRVGPPVYPLNYAVNERMEVVRQPAAPERPGFDAQASWNTVITRVVECPPAA